MRMVARVNLSQNKPKKPVKDKQVRDLFELQHNFTSRFFLDKTGKDLAQLSDEEKLVILKDYVLHLHQEVSSILEHTSYKMHRKQMENLIGSNVREEIIDVVKFSLGLWSLLGYDYDEFEKVFKAKSRVVEWRIEQEKKVEALRDVPVAILDIDGVLAQYPGPMLEYIGSLTGQKFNSLRECKNTLGLVDYEKMVTEYRTSGIKARLPLVPGAKEFINELNNRDIPIVLISARPYRVYLNILPDTLKWLELHELKCEALYFTDDKSLKIAKRFPRAKFFVDDNLNQVLNVEASNRVTGNTDLRVFLLGGEQKDLPPGIIQILELKKIFDFL